MTERSTSRESRRGRTMDAEHADDGQVGPDEQRTLSDGSGPVESIVTRSRAVPDKRPTLSSIDASVRRLPLPLWLASALLVGVVVAVAYLVSHPYPAYGAGLYLHIAEKIAASGYSLPERITLYAWTMPMAYPPLGFYLASLATVALNVDPITYSRVLPAVLTVTYLIPFYGLARELLESRRQAGIATALLATTPETLQWHLSSGGIVRGIGFLLALCGLYVGVRLFSRQRLRWVVLGAVLFTLTVLTHPVYTVFFGLSWVVFFGFLDRTPRGVAAGTVVAATGFLLTAPWWLQVVAAHGPDVFAAAAGTHSGLGGGVGRLLHSFVYPLDWSLTAGYFLVVYLATAVFLIDRRPLLPVWLLSVGYVVGKPRFLFVPGSMMVAAVTVERVGPWVDRRLETWRTRLSSTTDGGTSRLRSRRDVPALHGSGRTRARLGPDGSTTTGTFAVLPVIVLLVAATSVGGLYAAGGLPNAHAGSPSQPAFMDRADQDAMGWAENNTEPEAAFLVTGDAAEWFPLIADRPIIVGPWGVEWTRAELYERELETFHTVSTCQNASCLEHATAGRESPDYVYVSRDTYTVRGDERDPPTELYASLVASDRYRLAYQNDGVAVFRVAE